MLEFPLEKMHAKSLPFLDEVDVNRKKKEQVGEGLARLGFLAYYTSEKSSQ